MLLVSKDFPSESVDEGRSPPPLVCIVGYSGSGKTTLMVNLISCFARRGLRVGTIKHDPHGFNIDHPGKDSYRHKDAGATASLISSPTQVAMVADTDHDRTPEELLPMLPRVDIVLAEGFKRAPLPKIEVFRPETGNNPACQGDPYLLAVVSDAPVDWGIQRFASTDTSDLADHLISLFRIPAAKILNSHAAAP